MLDLKYNTLRPYLIDKTRLTALSSGSNFGYHEEDDHLFRRLDNFVSRLGHPDVDNYYSEIRNRRYPDLDREKEVGDFQIISDLLLPDTFRQHKGIEEKYRKGIPSYYDLVRIAEPVTKLGISMTRGYERHLVDSLGYLDNEYLNRYTIKPVI